LPDASGTGDRLDRFDAGKCGEPRRRRKPGTCRRAAPTASVGAMRLRWREIGCSALWVWLGACGTAPATPYVAPRHERAAPPVPAAAPTAASPKPAAAVLQQVAPPRPGRALSATLHEVELAPSALADALSAMRETRELATSFRPFSEQALRRAQAAQRAQQSTPGLLTTRAALLWSPARGERLLVLSGDTPQGATLLAYAPGASGAPDFAGSYQTRGEHAPILVGARPGAGEELSFSTCWACGGEGGALRLDGGGRPQIVLR
jgi:hypothetical protein